MSYEIIIIVILKFWVFIKLFRQGCLRNVLNLITWHNLYAFCNEQNIPFHSVCFIICNECCSVLINCLLHAMNFVLFAAVMSALIFNCNACCYLFVIVMNVVIYLLLVCMCYWNECNICLYCIISGFKMKEFLDDTYVQVKMRKLILIQIFFFFCVQRKKMHLQIQNCYMQCAPSNKFFSHFDSWNDF